MRKILFRGKTYDGEWIEGSLINAFEYTCILQSEDKLHPTDYPYLDGNIGTFDGKATPVIPKTVGQYTGLTDKNGKKIFEGDILSTENGTFSNTGMGHILLYKGMWVSFYGQDALGIDCFDELHTVCSARGVIGNIHDNPELVEGKDNEI